MLKVLLVAMAAMIAINAAPMAQAGPIKKAEDALDPDCNVKKAAKGAAMKSTVGVGNRCGAAETARDVTGVDGKGEDLKDAAKTPVKSLK